MQRVANPIRAVTLIAIVLLLSGSLFAQSQEKTKPSSRGGRSIAYYTKLLSNIALAIRENYMDDVNLDELFVSSYDGMLENLDPYSVLLKSDDYDALRESAYGRYEGIGIDIDNRDGEVTIIAPFEGAPAARLGFRPGDKIVKIDGRLVSSLSASEFNALAKGKAGTSVRLTIKRPGVTELLEYQVERAIIEIHPVKYYGMIEPTIGYVRVSKFAEKAGDEFRDALQGLKAKGCKSLILDLRANGGGLLDQAISIASQFLPDNKLVVYTRGKSAESERKYFSTGNSLFKDGELVVLVDSGTASAAEIVTGSLQDWDRGVIMGTATYGKGLVQNLFDWDDSDYALKLTTSRYYIPSGRSIQRPERSHKNGIDADRIESARDARDKKSFKTNAGRKVFAEGGISPDIAVDADRPRALELNLNRENLFFLFAVDYVGKHPKLPRDFDVDGGILSEFRRFVTAHGFEYKSELENKLDELEIAAVWEDAPESFSKQIASLRTVALKNKEQDFSESENFIRLTLKREILYVKYGDTAVYEEIITKEDPVVRQAVSLIKDRSKYRALLKG